MRETQLDCFEVLSPVNIHIYFLFFCDRDAGRCPANSSIFVFCSPQWSSNPSCNPGVFLGTILYRCPSRTERVILKPTAFAESCNEVLFPNKGAAQWQ